MGAGAARRSWSGRGPSLALRECRHDVLILSSFAGDGGDGCVRRGVRFGPAPDLSFVLATIPQA